MLKISRYHIKKKLDLIILVIFSTFFVSFWMIQGAEAASGERNPFALPAGIQKSTKLQNKEGSGPATGGQVSTPGFRVTTILVSGLTKVAGINGILKKKGGRD